MLKICTKCKIEKFLEEFAKDKYNKDGLTFSCKECRRPNSLKWNRENKEKLYELNLQWRKDNPERWTELKRKDYYKHREKRLATDKKYKEANKEKYSAYYAEYTRKREQKDILYVLRRRLRTRLYCAIHNNQKAGSAVQDLGCTIKQLKEYLESKFQIDMTWDNYGKWHIDHIKPLSNFDLNNRQQFLEACNYTNLQPLWATENLSKSNKPR